MPEQTAEPESVYSDLIREAYIDPIRTVTVIDDEYPTLDGMLARISTGDTAWEEDVEHVKKVQDILQFCREKEKPWLVDIHDGKNEEEAVAPYLHHSDLMILDYHLEGDDTNGAEKAIEILRTLATNDHFNMVVVYTKGYSGPENDIDRVVREIALALSAPDDSLKLSDETAQSVIEAIEEWEIEDEDILEKLKREITAQTYLTVRSAGSDCQKALGLPEGKALLELYKLRPKTVQVKPAEILRWLLSEKEKEIKEQLSPDPLGKVTLSDPGTPANWIRTDCLFVSVVSKRHSAQEIPEKLLQALQQWYPRPHRLLMAKMRALIDKQGAVAEAQVLSNDFIQTGWLLDLLDSEDQNKSGAISRTINRHWEALGDILAQDIYAFGQRLVTCLTSQDKKEILKMHSPLKPSDEANNINKHFNCYVSTKPVEGFHLTTGHILDFSNSENGKRYGICLSPACDLVPGQKKSGLGDRLPFIIVYLVGNCDKVAFQNIQQNIFLFFKIQNDPEPKIFSFHPNADIKANPSREQMFAENHGIFSDITNRELGIMRIVNGAAGLEIQQSRAKVMAQLRYEYALNLLQRLGVSMTRIGLDFKNISA